MSITGEVVTIASAVVAGAAAGWLSSVYAAGATARRQDSARRQLAAERAIAESVTEYLGRLRARELDARYLFPQGYAGIAGREHLAEEVVSQLPALPVKAGQRIRAIMLQLVGNKTLELAVTRLGVPADARLDGQTQAGQHAVIEVHMRLDYHQGAGCTQPFYRFCARDHYPQLREDYGVLGLLWLSLDGGHSGIHQAAWDEATTLLRGILSDVQPRRPRLLAGRLRTDLEPGST